VPAELQALDRWVCWQRESRDGKGTKVPYRAARPHERASSTDPSTWGPFDMAVAVAETGKAAGLGFVLGDGLVGIDLDNVLDEQNELRKDFPVEGIGAWLVALGSYVEISPSGRGLHVIGLGELPSWSRNRKGPVEVYSRDRYLTITGHVFEGLGRFGALRHLDDFLDAAGLRQPESTNGSGLPVVPIDLDDRELLGRAMRAKSGGEFGDLYEGRWEGRYPSQSEADQALCNKLAFWTGRDSERMDRLFRSSGLYRQKWGRDDYRERTLDKAIAGCGDTYTPRTRAQKSVESVAEKTGSETETERYGLTDSSLESVRPESVPIEGCNDTYKPTPSATPNDPPAEQSSPQNSVNSVASSSSRPDRDAVGTRPRPDVQATPLTEIAMKHRLA